MRVLIPTESRMQRAPDGSYWVRGPAHYDFWRRYLVGFDEVRVAARVEPVVGPPTNGTRVDGSGVTVADLPHYVGPRQYIRAYWTIRSRMKQEAHDASALMLRLPSPLAATARSLRRSGQPYGVEIVGDPDSVLAPGVVEHPLRPLLRVLMTRSVIRAAREASTVAYVTERVLQEKYPAHPDAFATYYSSVELGNRAFSGPRQLPTGRPRTLITVGSLDQAYKGIDTIIRALSTLRRVGLDVNLVVVGDGRLRGSYVALARECGLTPSVTFVGEVSAGEHVRRHLDEADVFVLASLTEGLPRAMLEAMARGLPCVGSRVGGIPELLSENRLFEPREVDQLAGVLTDVLTNPDEYAQESRRMIEVARGYEAWRLEQRRREHYAQLAKLAAARQTPPGRVR